jgi:protein SCO1/2
MKWTSLPVLAVSIMLAVSAHAELSETELSHVGLSLPNEARLPLSLSFRDDAGRSVSLAEALQGLPALVIPVDYTCKSTCGTALTLTSDALADSGLKPNSDFRLIVIGIDSNDRPDDARRMAIGQIHRQEITAASAVLLGDAPTTRMFLRDIGYRAVYDAAADQFAHPAIVLAIARDGRIVRGLSSLALDPTELRLALIDAGEGRIGTIGDRIRSICYGFDAAHGIYTPLVQRLLIGTGLVTIFLFAMFFAVAFNLPRRLLRRN